MEIPNWFAEHFLRLSGLETDGESSPVFGVTYQGGMTFDDCILEFLTADQIAEQWAHIGYLNQFMDQFELDEDFFHPDSVVPFAVTAGGAVYVSLSGPHNGAVFYSDNGDFGITRLADSIPEFLQSLNPSAL